MTVPGPLSFPEFRKFLSEVVCWVHDRWTTADRKQVNSGARGGWFRRGVMGVVVLVAVLVAVACGSVDEYSSTSIEETIAARAGYDPNRSSVGFSTELPSELAFADESQSITGTETGTADVDGNGGRDGTDFTAGSDDEGLSDDGKASLGGSGQNDQPDLAEPLTPDVDPSGRVYQRCVIDYGRIDWTAEAAEIVERHTVASAQPCTGEQWYEATAFQNGILIFMVLTGEQDLVASAPTSAAVEATATSLIAQGYPSVERMEIASSGACENGDIQLAMLQLRQGVEIDPTGLEELVASADEVGALVDQRNGLTLIAGGGSPCISGIVVKPGLVAWLTSRDASALVDAADFLTAS